MTLADWLGVVALIVVICSLLLTVVALVGIRLAQRQMRGMLMPPTPRPKRRSRAAA